MFFCSGQFSLFKIVMNKHLNERSKWNIFGYTFNTAVSTQKHDLVHPEMKISNRQGFSARFMGIRWPLTAKLTIWAGAMPLRLPIMTTMHQTSWNELVFFIVVDKPVFIAVRYGTETNCLASRIQSSNPNSWIWYNNWTVHYCVYRVANDSLAFVSVVWNLRNSPVFVPSNRINVNYTRTFPNPLL